MKVSIPGPCGELEGVLWLPEGVDAPRHVAVVCHPHPLRGGTMASTPVFRLARGLQEGGVAALRFHFRGVGASAGEHDGAGGEEDDALAALDWLLERYPGAEAWAAGFSFGARTVAACAPRDERIRRVLLVALPVDVFDCDAVDRVRTPGLVIQAARDEFGNLASLRARHPDLYPGLELAEIPAADHFFKRRSHELQALVAATARRWRELPA